MSTCAAAAFNFASSIAAYFDVLTAASAASSAVNDVEAGATAVVVPPVVGSVFAPGGAAAVLGVSTTGAPAGGVVGPFVVGGGVGPAGAAVPGFAVCAAAMLEMPSMAAS